MANKRSPQMKSTSVTLDIDILSAIKEDAKKTDKDVSKIINELAAQRYGLILKPRPKGAKKTKGNQKNAKKTQS